MEHTALETARDQTFVDSKTASEKTRSTTNSIVPEREQHIFCASGKLANAEVSEKVFGCD
jgi:hypothetical protein